VLHFFDFIFVKNGEDQEQIAGKRTWPETLLDKAESFYSTISTFGIC